MMTDIEIAVDRHIDHQIQGIKIATELFDKRDKLLEARKKAEQEWQVAKEQFERELLGE